MAVLCAEPDPTLLARPFDFTHRLPAGIRSRLGSSLTDARTEQAYPGSAIRLQTEQAMFRKFLIPTDGSEASLQAASAGIQLAQETGATVIAAFILQPVAETALYYGMSAMVAVDEQNLEESMRQQAQEAIDKVVQLARAADVPAEGRIVVDTFIPDGIVKAAQDGGCDLIFIGSHGRSGFRRLLLGSVTNKVIMLSHMPVLVYRIED
jgi:nucleotide-binding universal stress UspA family protein